MPAQKVDSRPASSDRPRPSGGVDALIVGLLMLVIAAAAAVVFVVAVGLLDPEQLIADDALRGQLFAFVEESRAERALIALASAVVGLGSLFLLIRRVGGGAGAPEGSSALVLNTDEHGVVLIGSEGVATVATAAVQRTPGVLEAQVRAHGRGQSPVRLRARISVHSGADVNQIGSAVRDAARSAVERLVGIEVTDVSVRIDVMSPEDLGREVL